MTEKLVIPRSRWLRGEGSGVSKLYRPSDGKSCCLGLYLESKGLTKEQLSDRACPSNLMKTPAEKLMPSWLIGIITSDSYANSTICGSLMEINDASTATYEDGEEGREQAIQERFARVGIAVEFVP